MKRILIVEDEYAAAEALALLLRSEGFDVGIARNGEEGLARMAERPPDLLIVDHMMPILDGRELLDRVRADPTLARIPAITMSSGRIEAFARHPQSSAFCSKPLRFETLLAEVRRLLA